MVCGGCIQMAAGKTGEFGSMDELGEDNDDVMAAYPTVLRYRESKALSAGITSSLLQSAAPVKDTSAVRKKGNDPNSPSRHRMLMCTQRVNHLFAQEPARLLGGMFTCLPRASICPCL